MFDDYDNDYFYEIYIDKKPAQELLKKIKLFSAYEVCKAEYSSRVITYYDTPSNSLDSVKLLLSTDLINGTGELTLEKNLDNNENAKYVRLLQTYEHSTAFNDSQSVYDFIPFLRESIRSFFNQPLDIDTDNIFKKVVPTYIINIKNESYKIASFDGFKCWLTLEYTTYINASNKRENYVTYVKISKSRDSEKNDMPDFIAKLEKYCKRIYKITKTKHSECVRLTRDIDIIIKNKKKAEKDAAKKGIAVQTEEEPK